MATVIKALYVNSTTGAPITGLTPQITIWKDDDESAAVKSAQNMTELGNGWYYYNFDIKIKGQGYVYTIDGTASAPAIDRYQGNVIPGGVSPL